VFHRCGSRGGWRSPMLCNGGRACAPSLLLIQYTDQQRWNTLLPSWLQTARTASACTTIFGGRFPRTHPWAGPLPARSMPRRKPRQNLRYLSAEIN
jgi:hypothetical protein